MTEAGSTDDRLRAFFVQTLALWQIEATVEAAEFPQIAIIRSADGTRVTVAQPASDTPFRWRVETVRPSDGAATAPRVLPCGSLVGVLGALRRSFGVERGSPIRVVSDPA
jgi:hypothetical protein